MKKYYPLTALPTIATALLRAYPAPRVYALKGDLGTGKTTLVAECCRQLGVTEPTSSPTFSIVNEYEGTDGPVFHLDCYRLETTEEALAAGLEELFTREDVPIFVEWPAVIEPLLPEDVVYLRLRHTPGGEARELSITTGYHPPENER